MELTPEQQEHLLNGKKRTGLIDSKYRWPNNIVPYEFSNLFSNKQKELIKTALKHIEAVSCLKFVRRTNQVNYVEVNV